MAGTEEKVAPEATTTNGHEAGQVPVENPATGEVIAHVPDLTAEQVREMAKRGRAAQPGWEALGFAGRARVMLRMQKWLLDNADRVIETIVKETGKSWEDAQLAEISYGANAFGFWAKNAPKYLADERVRSALAARGIDDLSLVQVDVLSSGAFDHPLEGAHRFGKAVLDLKRDPSDNAYARPI
jgi:acyl-CoA reductase-like NAD-dependent aldehyde dehydrogenase